MAWPGPPRQTSAIPRPLRQSNSSFSDLRELREPTVEDMGFEQLDKLDAFLHERSRMRILAALESCSRVPFAFLRRVTGLSDGNISGHLTKLEGAGYVTIEKTFQGRRPKTFVGLTDEGRASVEAYWKHVEGFIEKRKCRRETR